MPQAPGEGGAPSDIGPDGGVLPPDAMGPDGLPVDPGAVDPDDPGAVEDGEDALPFGDGDGDADEDGDFPPGDDEDDAPPGDPGPPPKNKKKSARQLVRTYTTASGEVLDEDTYVRHLAATSIGGPEVLAALRAEAAGKAYTGHYNRGWKAGSGSGAATSNVSPLERADQRGEPEAWYHGYHDAADDRPKFHSRDCPAKDHYGDPACTLMGG